LGSGWSISVRTVGDIPTTSAPKFLGDVVPANLADLAAPSITGVVPAVPARFDDLYTAVYAILDEAKASRSLVKLYKGSHLAADPHPHVLDFASFFARCRCGPVSFVCRSVNPDGPWRIEDLDMFDHRYRPRISMRGVFDELCRLMRRPDEPTIDVLYRLVSRTHDLGAYRGGSSGFDEETQVIAAHHFRGTGVPSTPHDVTVFNGGAKGAFLAFCAALMCRRRYDTLHHLGGVMLAPEGYYQSLRFIPAVFGATIDRTPNLVPEHVARWLSTTAGQPHRAMYVPLVNNATGQVLTHERAHELAAEITRHNQLHPDNPVFVLGDDVYTDSILDPALDPTPIGAVPGMAGCTVSVVSPSKTFALPTSRVAFATTANPTLRAALRHYRTVFSHGRVPQVTELTAAAALALTPTAWTQHWNQCYRDQLARLRVALEQINAELTARRPDLATIGPVVDIRSPQGGWYIPLSIARAALPIPTTSSVEVFAMLLHYGDSDTHSGLGTLPGELFGQRLTSGHRHATLRATLAVSERDHDRFTGRLREALLTLTGPHGADIARRAVQRARCVADIDTILAHTRY
jgi:aspartate/methionine/tyrosine aminotransferase